MCKLLLCNNVLNQFIILALVVPDLALSPRISICAEATGRRSGMDGQMSWSPPLTLALPPHRFLFFLMLGLLLLFCCCLSQTGCTYCWGCPFGGLRHLQLCWGVPMHSRCSSSAMLGGEEYAGPHLSFRTILQDSSPGTSRSTLLLLWTALIRTPKRSPRDGCSLADGYSNSS